MDSLAACKVVKASVCETLDQVSILAGKNRAVHLCCKILWDIKQASLRGLDTSDSCEASGPLWFLKKWNEINEDRTTLHFNEVVRSCCLFTDINHSVADYVFVPRSNLMFSWDGSHFTVALAWNV